MFQLTDIPLSLYVHFPWCVKKCPYCDFNSHTLRGDIDEQEYIRTLLKDLDQQLSRWPQSRPLTSVFLGGGTPNLFGHQSVGQLLNGISQRFDLPGNAEVTMEANPGASSDSELEGYFHAGINRLSIGAQTFNFDHLRRLGRVHSGDDTARMVDAAKASGFSNINIDLMFALPDQSIDQLDLDLETALNMEPTHLSCYQLTLEPNTLFYSHPPELPDESVTFEMQNRVVDTLGSADFHRYEVSAYSRSDRLCRHNLNYWQFGDYLAIGAGAHGKLTTDAGLIRTIREKHPRNYINKMSGDIDNSFAEVREVADEELPFEFLLNGLRLRAGVSRDQYVNRTGKDWTQLIQKLSRPIDQKLIALSDNGIACTDKGYWFIDSCLESVLPG
ncbi:MAG: radical SAM family heme chaperone HemW [Pseudomonadota bacterium]